MANDDQFLLVPVADVARLSDALAQAWLQTRICEGLWQLPLAGKQLVSLMWKSTANGSEQVFRKVLLGDRVGINATLPEVQRTASELQA